MRALIPLLFIFVFVGVPQDVDADKRDDAFEHVSAGDAHKKRAEELKKDGRDALAAQRFLDAAVEYQAAYDLVPHPLMLYNLAQVYRYAGDKIQALAFYQEFLDTDPDGPAAVAARKYAIRLKERLKRETPDTSEPDPEDNDPKDTDQSNDGEQDGTADPVDPSLADDRSDGGGQGLRYAGLASVAVGAVALGFGIKFGLDAKNTSDYLTNYNDDAWTEGALALQAEGKTSEKRMFLLTGIGAAAILAGGVMYVLGSRDSNKEQQASLQVLPAMGTDQVGFTLAGPF